MQGRQEQLEALRSALQRRGWRIRDGAQYGADLLLYSSSSTISRKRKGMGLHQMHAPFLLLLLDSSVTWRVICGASRLAASVRKELLLAVPQFPSAVAPSTLTAPLDTVAAGSPAAGPGGRLSFRVVRLRRFWP